MENKSENPYGHFPEKLEKVSNSIDLERLMHGSDINFWEYGGEVGYHNYRNLVRESVPTDIYNYVMEHKLAGSAAVLVSQYSKELNKEQLNALHDMAVTVHNEATISEDENERRYDADRSLQGKSSIDKHRRSDIDYLRSYMGTCEKLKMSLKDLVQGKLSTVGPVETEKEEK